MANLAMAPKPEPRAADMADGSTDTTSEPEASSHSILSVPSDALSSTPSQKRASLSERFWTL